MNNPSFPSFDQFPQGMDFLKQFWAHGASAAPTANPAASPTPALQQVMGQYLMPTFDLDELDKRMTDLRTVLQFMELNTNMLRQSLQALEVQRNTLATLKSMAQPKTEATKDDTSNPAAPWMAAWQGMMQNAQATVAAASKTAAPVAATATASATKKPAAKKAAAKTTKKKA
jgi:hypothetical protein